MPASASAPAMTLSSIGIEPERVCEDESAAASGDRGDGGGWLPALSSAGASAARLAVGRCAVRPTEFTPDGSGQRDATTDRCASASGALALSCPTGRIGRHGESRCVVAARRFDASSARAVRRGRPRSNAGLASLAVGAIGLAARRGIRRRGLRQPFAFRAEIPAMAFGGMIDAVVPMAALRAFRPSARQGNRRPRAPRRAI